MPPVLPVRFWKSVTVGDGCWTWIGVKTPGGYGRLKHQGKQIAAHRVSWMIHNGPVPDGMFVLHRCDNRPCVRPEHLFLGTKADNNIDMLDKGRHDPNRGESNGQSKLTSALVLALRADRGTGLYTQQQLAIKYGVRQSAVNNIIHRKRWNHI